MSEDPGRETIHADEYSTLSEAIADAVESQSEPGPEDEAVALDEEFDLDAVDDVIREDARPETSVELQTNERRVKVWGDGSVEVVGLDLRDEG